MGLCKVRFCLTESTQAFEAHFLSSAALSSLHGCSCGCLADMEELSAAAATLAVSMDVADIDDLGVEDTNTTAGAAKVLSAIDANQGVLSWLDALSSFPSKPWGASSSDIFPSHLALFRAGRSRRQRAGGGPGRDS